jgi:hypothetical protein
MMPLDYQLWEHMKSLVYKILQMMVELTGHNFIDAAHQK